MGDVLKMAGAWSELQERAALAVCSEGWVGLQYGWFPLRQGSLRLWVVERVGHPQDLISVQHTSSASKPNAWGKKEGAT